jgi:hypothetical protein
LKSFRIQAVLLQEEARHQAARSGEGAEGKKSPLRSASVLMAGSAVMNLLVNRIFGPLHYGMAVPLVRILACT